ncbi:HlyD family secretion protein [Roseomonas sp. BN140053]|uniref:HlyD family secretion protein n=1 Tax=Roseomonas sp. BN140053 TaxID=3391898 RepID=UPI0039E96667
MDSGKVLAQGEAVEAGTPPRLETLPRPARLREVTAEAPTSRDASGEARPEAPVARDAPAESRPAAAPPPAAPRPRRRWLRRTLLLLGPVLVLAGGVALYLTGGRTVSTDNAYVRADKLNVATDVSGIVSAIAVRDNQRVERGQVLFRLDQEPFRIALAGAEADLGNVRNEIATLQATYRQSLAQVAQARTDIEFTTTNFGRQQELTRRGIAAQATFDQARRELDQARDRVTVAQRQAEATLAQLGGRAEGTAEQNPRFLAAQARVDSARRDLNRTVVTAPMAGIVTNVNALQVGQYLPAAQPGFSLVSTEHAWIEANPKETDLTYLLPGNPATVTVDTYPGREWHARVDSISPATGAEFSVLPAQNSSGNWVKVVQRIPIRLEIETPPDAPPLRAGMSVDVAVDTGHTRSLAGLMHDLRQAVGF